MATCSLNSIRASKLGEVNMSITLSRLYDDYAAATLALQELESVGVPASDVSIVASNAENWYSSKGTMSSASTHDRDRDGADDRGEGAAAGAGIGATIGGIAGLLAGVGIIAIPGIGPVVAAGWLASAAAVAAAGGVAGGILGGLTEAGVSQEDAQVYAEGVRRGGTLLTVRVLEADQARVRAILDRSAVNIREREMAYRKSGWSSFDTNAPPYTADQVRKERDLYRRNAA
jgi:hypothetical protein